MKNGIASIAIVLAFALINACSYDRIVFTRFEPPRIEKADIYRFTAFSDSIYPLESKEAEQTRIAWLEVWLNNNGFDTDKYEIVSRQPILKVRGLGEVYDIYYDVRVIKR